MTAGLTTGDDGRARCWWGSGPEYEPYHDTEWGFPVVDDRRLFEKLSLEGFQAGLSWLTILRKREAFRAAFAGFEIEKVAAFESSDITRLLGDAGIVRHRGKIEATINNARRGVAIRDEFGSLAAYVWQWETVPANRPATMTKEALLELSTSPESHALSKDLKGRGWRFVGPTTVYAFMQAMGLVNDHLAGCFVTEQVDAARAGFSVPNPG